MQNIQPVNGNVLIEFQDEKESKTAGGIIIPETAREKPSEGVIAGIAADASEQIAVGDRVIYKAYSGTEISYNGKDYLIVPVGDILAKYVDVDAI